MVVTASAAISLSSNLVIPDAIRYTTSLRYPGSIVPLVLLDGNPLSAHNRTFSDSISIVAIENVNWNNKKSKYFKRSSTSGRLNFRFSWDWLPSERQDTVDKRYARNFLVEKAKDPDIHVLSLFSYGTNPEDPLQKTDYNVYITNYSEDLIRRDLSAGIYFWKCSMDFEEA